MTYLSRFEFHRARREAKRLLASPNSIHGAVLAAFRAPPTGSSVDRLLWRIDQNDHRAVLYLLSSQAPDLTHLVEAAGWLEGPGWETIDYTPMLAALAVGQEWGFRLVANPARSIRDRSEGRSRRVGHVTAEQQRSWLAQRASSIGASFDMGFAEPSIALTCRSQLVFGHKGSTISIATAQFDGMLKVVDVGLLRRALVEGIGPAKAYGCGLMTLARHAEQL